MKRAERFAIALVCSQLVGSALLADEPAPAVAVSATAPAPTGEPLLEKLLKGFYGSLDVSFDYTTKGIGGLVGYPYQLNDPNNPASGFSPAGGPKGGPVGRVDWMPAMSTNKSAIGYRGEHRIGDSPVGFLYQVEAGVAITASPGVSTGWVAQSNAVKTAIGAGDTYVGFRHPEFGSIKFGTTYSPYKKSTDRMNPFAGQIGDYAVVMGNSGGDNRVEFGTRLDHSIWYESPKLFGALSLDLLWSPGQNRTYDNVIQSAGSPDCNGGNQPGSGNADMFTRHHQHRERPL